MTQITLVCVGRLKEKHYIAACAEYEKRLKGMCKLEIIELAEQTEGAHALEREAEKILAAVPPQSLVLALCVEGERMTSPALAALLQKSALSGVSKLCVIIGSSNGLSERVKQLAQLRLSMSDMTFPHHLARVMALEQLYRALSINAGSKYHK